MAINLGNSTISKAYLGSTEITKAYLGSTLVFGGGAVYDSDAQAFIDAIGTLTLSQKNAVNQLVLDMKSAGVWAKGHAYYPMVGGTAFAHKWNLMNPLDTDAAYRGVYSGGWTHDATGAKGNGSTAYMDTKLIPSTHLTTSDTALVYTSGTNTGHNTIDIGSQDPSDNKLFLATRYAANSFYSDCYNSFSGRVSASSTSGDGVWIQSRTASNVHKVFRNAVQQGTTGTGTAGTLPTLSVTINARNYSPSPISHSPRLCQGAGIFNGLTDTEVSDLTTAIQTFNTALGR